MNDQDIIDEWYDPEDLDEAAKELLVLFVKGVVLEPSVYKSGINPHKLGEALTKALVCAFQLGRAHPRKKIKDNLI